MAQRRIFTVTTPLGDRVFLTRDRWREIIRFKHPAMAGHEKDVRECLESPAMICESDKDEEVHLYYRAARDVFVCVVVAPDGTGERFVVTAYLTKRIKKGKQRWTS
jgi:hypothetical protein